MQVKWTKKFPKKEGNYWFYGYRYGKISCGQKCEPELMVVTVNKCANGLLYVDSGGQFMYESETEDAHFAPMDMPEIPKFFKSVVQHE